MNNLYEDYRECLRYPDCDINLLRDTLDHLDLLLEANMSQQVNIEWTLGMIGVETCRYILMSILDKRINNE